MKIFGFYTSIIMGIISAWLVSDTFIYIFSFNQIELLIYSLVALIVSGFISSFSLAKDTLPPKIPYITSLLFDETDTPSKRRVATGMFASSLFICLKTTYLFLIQPYHYANNVVFVILLYIGLIFSFFFVGLIVGGVGGNAGAYIRKLLENEPINK